MNKHTLHLTGAYLLAAALCLLNLYYISYYPLNNDTGYFLEVARRVLAGEKQYIDILHSNTPFITYYSMLPVWLAQQLSVNVIECFLVCFCLLLTACAFLSVYVFSRNPAYREPLVLYPGTVFVTLLVCFYASPLKESAFSEREHFFVALCMPYFLSVLNRLRGIRLGKGESLWVGAFGFLGFVIKPHFVLVYVFSELYLMWVEKSWRVAFRRESSIIGFGFFFAHMAVIILCPEYLALLPHMSDMYAGQQYSWLELPIPALRETFIEFLGSALLLSLVYRRASPLKVELRYIIVLIAAGFVVFFIHRAAYTYQALPMRIFFLLLAAFITFHYRQGQHNQSYFVAVVLSGMILLLNPLREADQFGKLVLAYEKREEAFKQLREHFHGKSTLLVSTSMWPGYPVLNYAGMKETAHLSIMIYVPGYYRDQQKAADASRKVRFHKPEEMPVHERYFFDHTVEDVVNKKPGVLMVNIADDKQWLEGMDFDLVAYLSQDKRFAEAWRHYRRVDTLRLKKNMLYQIEDIAFYVRID